MLRQWLALCIKSRTCKCELEFCTRRSMQWYSFVRVHDACRSDHQRASVDAAQCVNVGQFDGEDDSSMSMNIQPQALTAFCMVESSSCKRDNADVRPRQYGDDLCKVGQRRCSSQPWSGPPRLGYRSDPPPKYAQWVVNAQGQSLKGNGKQFQRLLTFVKRCTCMHTSSLSRGSSHR